MSGRRVIQDARDDARVAIDDFGATSYGDRPTAEQRASAALTRCGKQLGLHDERRGPLGAVIPEGAKVLVKPNLVLHHNLGTGGTECLVTNAAFIQAATQAALLCDPSSLIVGDAPIQSCDFAALLEVTGLGEWAQQCAAAHNNVQAVKDFRRTAYAYSDGVRTRILDRLPLDQFILFDLGTRSMLEPVTDANGGFRVTCYDPRAMSRTHAPGRHQYLVARDVIEADVVINVPKLKMHKKAGITCALKNLVGINGNKEYLPHHRIGGSESGGDCYPGKSPVKRALESVLDRQNLGGSAARVWQPMVRLLGAMLHLQGDRIGVEGSWSGNDTVWRMTLDLNRILLYGRTDGTLADEPQREIISFVDAVVAGEGEGPLAPSPLPLGLALMSRNPAAVDWIGTQLLRFDPEKVPLVRQAFQVSDHPLAFFAPADVVGITSTGEDSALSGLQVNRVRPTHFPAGWQGAVAEGTRTAIPAVLA